MRSLPDIIVLDFCEWLMQKMEDEKSNYLSVYDFVMDQKNFGTLRAYAGEFLQKHQEDQDTRFTCSVQSAIYKFIVSKDFIDALKKSQTHCSLENPKYFLFDRCQLEKCFYTCFHSREVLRAWKNFCRKTENTIREDRMFVDRRNEYISPYDLASYIRNLVFSSSIEKDFPVMHLMINSKAKISDVMDFLEWLQFNQKRPESVQKMPSKIFEQFVDEYIQFSEKTEIEKKKLMKIYRETGWEIIFRGLQKTFNPDTTDHSHTLSEMIDHYCNHRVKFKCIILPLSETMSQIQYQQLISDGWSDLNSVSQDYLDIYYSEADTGKSGFDIANRIKTLPDELKTKAPCLIVWENRITEAKYIPIENLTNKQIIFIIKNMIEKMKKTDDFDIIMKEALSMAKKFEIENRPIGTYIQGDGNFVGSNNDVSNSIVKGDGNTTITGGDGNTVVTNQHGNEQLLYELSQAQNAIKECSELNDEVKNQLILIMQNARDGAMQHSQEKSENAKKEFSILKNILCQAAPALISVLANFTQIASFFGL